MKSAIRGELFVFPGQGEISVGDWCYVGEHSRIWAQERITIGNRVLVSHGCNIFDCLTHPISASARHEQFRAIFTGGHPDNVDLCPRPVTLEDDVWIGCGVTILRGVSIGRGAIVGAGSVVVSDVSPWSVFAGNPARLIRELHRECP
jgi:acetyltransferase-like isoleucine patch superfamily enzyme